MLCLQRSPAADVVLIAMLGEDRSGALGWVELARCAGLRLAGRRSFPAAEIYDVLRTDDGLGEPPQANDRSSLWPFV